MSKKKNRRSEHFGKEMARHPGELRYLLVRSGQLQTNQSVPLAGCCLRSFDRPEFSKYIGPRSGCRGPRFKSGQPDSEGPNQASTHATVSGANLA